MIKLDGRANRQAEAMKARQRKIEDLTGGVIRLESRLELLIRAAMVKRLKGGSPRPAFFRAPRAVFFGTPS